MLWWGRGQPFESRLGSRPPNLLLTKGGDAFSARVTYIVYVEGAWPEYEQTCLYAKLVLSPVLNWHNRIRHGYVGSSVPGISAAPFPGGGGRLSGRKGLKIFLRDQQRRFGHATETMLP